VRLAREEFATKPDETGHLPLCLRMEAYVLDSLGRLDEAEWVALCPGERLFHEAMMRKVIGYMATGRDALAEPILRCFLFDVSLTKGMHKLYPTKIVEDILRPHTVLAELLERRGTEEALAEARTLRDGATQQLARHEARRAAALEEMREAAAEAVRQWREERIVVRSGKKGGKGKRKGKKKGRKGKAKGKGASSGAAAIEGEPPHEPAGGEAEGTAAAETEQQAPVGESQPQGEEEKRGECAVCLQELELEEDEDPWCDEGGEGEAVVMLRCGHRFHEICGDMWRAKCADKGWGITCPNCRAPYLVART
jgi:hypothetical protein